MNENVQATEQKDAILRVSQQSSTELAASRTAIKESLSLAEQRGRELQMQIEATAKKINVTFATLNEISSGVCQSNNAIHPTNWALIATFFAFQRWYYPSKYYRMEMPQGLERF